MDKPLRSIFVIMPFVKAPTRGEDELTQFYEYFLKRPIEECNDFKYAYRVTRSGNAFDITAKIIQDLYDADIVICDLSGEHANPNVMYELGVRLALTHKPVIMIREDHMDNKKIFDVGHYHTQPYRTNAYSQIETYIKDKIMKFENGIEAFRSPVLTILGTNPTVISEIERQRVVALLVGLRKALLGTLRTFGGSLHSFLSASRPALLLPKAVAELPQFIHDNRTTLQTLNWAAYRFAPALPPQLHTLLSDTRLSVVCDQWLADLWNQVFGDYYGKYFSSTFFWDDTDFDSVYPYTMDTWHLIVAIELFVDLLAAGDAASKKQLMCGMFKAMRPMSLISDEFRLSVLNQLIDAHCSGTS